MYLSENFIHLEYIVFHIAPNMKLNFAFQD